MDKMRILDTILEQAIEIIETEDPIAIAAVEETIEALHDRFVTKPVTEERDGSNCKEIDPETAPEKS